MMPDSRKLMDPKAVSEFIKTVLDQLQTVPRARHVFTEQRLKKAFDRNDVTRIRSFFETRGLKISDLHLIEVIVTNIDDMSKIRLQMGNLTGKDVTEQIRRLQTRGIALPEFDIVLNQLNPSQRDTTSYIPTKLSPAVSPVATPAKKIPSSQNLPVNIRAALGKIHDHPRKAKDVHEEIEKEIYDRTVGMLRKKYSTKHARRVYARQERSRGSK